VFLDRATIRVRAGDGGDGAATFRREAHVPRGGPDGGDGGRGGSIFLRVDPGQTALIDFRFKRDFRADSGGRGTRARRHGKAGRDLELAVPPGTAIYDDATGDLLGDLVVPDQRLMVARGGRGGLGNVHFATATHRTPRHAQKGEPGEERTIRLELRLIADIGLVGLPNAGKSTLLAALTAARPKIAPYPFTTVEPNLGVMDLAAVSTGDETVAAVAGLDDRRPTIADVPGLIEGASRGAGLGHAFLRHVERTRVLGHVVDASADNPERDYAVIREELRFHDPALLLKPTLVIANKIDLPDARDRAAEFVRTRERAGVRAVAVSALNGENIDELLRAFAALLPSAEELTAPPAPAGLVVHRFDSAQDGFAVVRERDGFRVRGRRIERLAAQTDFGNDESAERFQRDLDRLGIARELKRAGVSQGDTVRIGSHEMEWDPEWD
jgi:GTP-binding protein